MKLSTGVIAAAPPSPPPASAATAAPPSLALAITEAPAPMLLPERPLVHSGLSSRWSASTWLILRGGVARPDAAQLGGSQLGGRMAYMLDDQRHFALSVRVMAPLHGRGAEMAAGLDWQPLRAPVHMLVERWFGIDGGPGGTSLMLAGGVDPLPVAAGWHVEAYGQAGAVARTRVEGFADGAVRLGRPVTGRDGVVLDLGLGAWGGIQRDAGRLDLGPSAALIVPVGDARVRVTLDWRQRVAGAAQPGPGPALSIATGF